MFSYSPCPSDRKLATTNGSLIIVAGVGDVRISPSLILKNVLHVPKLSTNLVSIQKFTWYSCYNMVFHHNNCVFQDEDSGKMIGHAKERDGLYYLETLSNSNITKSKLSHSFISEFFSSNKEKAWLYHRRLGNPSFRTIKIMFPSLFKGFDVKDFHCEVRELAKHKHVPFSVSNKISSNPFYLIHSDIWGPSTFPNIFGTRWFVSFIDDFLGQTQI